MANGKGSLDAYAFPAVFALKETTVNTLTLEKLETGLSVYDRVGWVIQRIEIALAVATYGYMNATGDAISVGLTTTSNLTTLADDNPAVLYLRRFVRLDFGTAATGSIQPTVFESDFTNLAGGGLLTLPNPIYGAILGNSLTTAGEATIRLYIKAVPLTDQDYFNLAQARQLLISA